MIVAMFRPLLFGFIACSIFSACGGATSPGLPQTAGPATPKNTSNIVIAIKIPGATSAVAGLRRRPLYISTATQSASIGINGASPTIVSLVPTAPNCAAVSGGGRTCTLAVNAPIGSDTFLETLYSGAHGDGAILSTGKTSATIVAGTANTVTLALDGLVASLSLMLADPSPPQGPPGTIGLTVNFNDAGGAAIIGSAPFATPVSLSDSDTSGATAFSKSVLKSPADAAALSLGYTGATLAQARIGATSGGVVANTVTLAPVPVNFNDYTTFGFDNQRDVYNPNTATITPARIANVHLAWQSALGGGDYNTQTQPILATEIAGHKGVLYVGGGSGNVYGYDALTGARLWAQGTGQETYTCENSNTFYFGVGGTAAYDPGSKSIYVVGNANASPNTVATNSLYHLDGTAGTVIGQVNFAPPVPGWNSLDFSHTAVTLGSNGLAYVGTGATCDISSWRGRIAAISVGAGNVPMQLSKTFYTVWNGTTQPWGGGGVWGWGGVSLDFNGNVLTGVGNTDNGSTTHGSIVAPYAAAPQEYSALGDAFIKISADLTTLEDSQHPIAHSAFTGNSVDLDMNGTPAVFQPNGAGCDPMAALQGKSGALYLYDAANIGSGLRAQYQLSPSTYADGFLGAPAYSPATGLLYAAVPSSSNSLYPPGMIAIDPGCGSPSVTWHSTFGPDSYPSGVPRSVPAASAGGVLFIGTPCNPDGKGGCSATATSAVARSAQNAQRKPAICCAPPGPGGGALWALDASTGTVLNNGVPVITTSGPIRVPPTIDGNWIFVLDNNGDMYGLTIDARYAATAATVHAIDARTLKRWQAPPRS